MRSAKQRTRSKINGAQSKGPTSPLGRSISSKNALSHGLTARQFSLPDEDPQERHDRAVRLAHELNPQTEVQNELFHGLRTASDLRHRNQRALHGTLTDQVRTAKDTRNPKIARDLERAKLLFFKRPLEAILILRRSAEGCRWLLDHWIEVRDRLKKYGIMTEPDLNALLRLLGEALSIHITPLVCDLVYLAVGTWSIPAPFNLTIVLRDLPEPLLQQYRRQWPTPQAHCQELLRRIEDRIAELQAQITELEAREQAERAGRVAQAMMIAHEKKAGLWLRYFKEANSEFYRVLREFHAEQDRDAALAAEAEGEAEEDADEESVAEDESPPLDEPTAPGPPIAAVPVASPTRAAPEVPQNDPASLLHHAGAGTLRGPHRNEPGVPVGTSVVPDNSSTYVAKSGINSDSGSGLAKPAGGGSASKPIVPPPFWPPRADPGPIPGYDLIA